MSTDHTARYSCFHQTHTCTSHTHTWEMTHKRARAQTHAQTRDRRKHSFRLTTTHISLHYRLPSPSLSVSLLMPPALMHRRPCRRLAPSQPPTIKSRQNPRRPFSRTKAKTKYLNRPMMGASSSPPSQSTAQHRVDTEREERKIQSGMDEWRKSQCRFTAPLLLGPPSPSSSRTSVLCPAMLG